MIIFERATQLFSQTNIWWVEEKMMDDKNGENKAFRNLWTGGEARGQVGKGKVTALVSRTTPSAA